MSSHDPNHDESTQRLMHEPFLPENGSVTIKLSAGMAPHSDWSEKTVISTRPPSIEAAPPAFPTPQSLGQLLVGKSLDHYDLAEFVGGGGMGAVFRATDTRLGRTVAVKVLSRDHTDDETIKRFRNEATSAARLDHPNIARVYYVGEALGWNYIVFEFIEGINVRELVANEGVLRVEDALRFTLKIAEALEHASKRDVVHRDIKPSNILVTPQNDVKLVDMGLARLHQVESSSDDLTASGVTLGTFDYISPEQARDPRTADVRSDIYSLGCTLFYMLCGRPPFPDGTALQKLLWHSGEEPPEMSLFRSDLPPRLVAMVNRMLAKRPNQRFQTAADLATEIIELAEEAGLPPLGNVVAAPVHIAPPPRTEWATAVSILAPFGMLAAVVLLLEAFLPQGNAAGERPFAPRLTTTAAVAAPMEVIKPLPPEEKPVVSPERITPPADTERSPIKPPPSEDRTDPPAEGKTPPPATTGNPALDTAIAAVVGSATNPPPKGKPLTKVTLRPGENKPESGVVGQLGAAMKLAVEKGLTDIELAFDGPLVEKSFDIPNQTLNIRAADGSRPVLVFRPKSGGLQDEQRLIRIAGAGIGKVHWKGVEFVVELPPDSSSLGWSLFALSQVHTLALEKCVVTLKNGGATGPIHFPVSVFEFVQPRSSEMMMEGATMATPTVVSLEQSFVRGACSLLVMHEETPCEFVAKQSLLAVADHLFVTTGAVAKPKWHGRIEWRLEHVTAFAGRGLYQLQRRDDSSYQFDLDIRADHCRFLTPPKTPLFEVQNGPRASDMRLQFDGVGNAYAAEDAVFLRIRAKGEDQLDFDLQRRQDWSNERRPRFDAVLPAATTDRPWHALTEDLLAPTGDMPPADGVDALQLNEPWSAAPAAAESTAEGS